MSKEIKYIVVLIIMSWLVSCSKTQITSSVNYALNFNGVNKDTAYSQKYTCDGDGISPMLSWSNAPQGTKSYAITIHHIPGPGDKHVYMVVYDIDSTIMNIAEGTQTIGLWGINTVNGTATYTPPCSQGPGEKMYTISVHALSSAKLFSSTPSKVTMDNLLTAMDGKILASTKLNLSYSR